MGIGCCCVFAVVAAADIVWVWNHYGCGYISLARGYCESPHHHRNRWIFLCSCWKKSELGTAAQAAVYGRPEPVTQARDLMSPNMMIHFLSSRLSWLLAGSSVHWPVSLKVISLPIIFQIPDRFCKERMGFFFLSGKGNFFMNLRNKFLGFNSWLIILSFNTPK